MGRRLGYLGRYRDAIAIFSRGIAKFPDDVRLLRYRGHRYITVREPDKAIADLAKADELIRSRGLKDAPEPDGIPGPPGSTPSTLFFNVYYHLGLAHYLKGRLCLGREGVSRVPAAFADLARQRGRHEPLALRDPAARGQGR